MSDFVNDTSGRTYSGVCACTDENAVEESDASDSPQDTAAMETQREREEKEHNPTGEERREQTGNPVRGCRSLFQCPCQRRSHTGLSSDRMGIWLP